MTTAGLPLWPLWVMINHDPQARTEDFMAYVEQMSIVHQVCQAVWETHLDPQQNPASPDLYTLYTANGAYLLATTQWETDLRKMQLYAALLTTFADRTLTLLDLGCGLGLTGLTLLVQGYAHVTFCDFEGLGLRCVRAVLERLPQFAGRWTVTPYGEETPADVVIAADVLEHVGKHLNFLRWIASLSRVGFALTYPLTRPFERPYEDTVDGWVDDEAIRVVLCTRYSNLLWMTKGGGRLAVVRYA